MVARCKLLTCLLFLVFIVKGQYAITVDSVKCHGGSDGSIQIWDSMGNAYYYRWSNGDSIIPAIFGSSINSLSAGTYSCTISNIDSIPLDTLSFVIKQPGSITFSHAVQNSSCPGTDNGSITETVQGGTPPYNVSATKKFLNFNFADNGVISGLDSGWYTIIISDYNGCTVEDTAFVGFSSTICTGLTDIQQIAGFTLQPNPAINVTQITYELNEPLWLNISIYDPSGKKVQQILNGNETEGLHTHPISLSFLTTGIYILNVVSDKGSINIKLIKE